MARRFPHLAILQWRSDRCALNAKLEHQYHPRVGDEHQAAEEDGAEDSAQTPVVFGWQVAGAVVNRAWAGAVRSDDPHHAQRGHHHQAVNRHVDARNGRRDGQHRR